MSRFPHNHQRAFDVACSLAGAGFVFPDFPITSAALVGEHPGATSTEVNAAPRTVWSSTTSYVWPQTAHSIEVVSTSPNDTFGGTGANFVQWIGLDADGYVAAPRVWALSGTTPSLMPGGTVWRTNGALCVAAGSGQVNTGNITFRIAGGGATQAMIPAGTGGPAKRFIYTVPRDHFGVIGNWGIHLYEGNGASSQDQIAKVTQRIMPAGPASAPVPGSNIWLDGISFSINLKHGSQGLQPTPPPPALPPLTDIDARIVAVSSPGTVRVSTAMNMMLVPASFQLGGR